jgi:glycosyltransferase involved in cell wall biosynthesis
VQHDSHENVVMSVERIVFTGDVFRTTSGDADQLWNVSWLRDEFAPVLHELTGLWPIIRYRLEEPTQVREPMPGLGRNVIAEWYRCLGHTPSPEAWAATFAQSAPPALIDLMRPDYERGLVIGFELSPLMRSILDGLRTPWIDVGVSPIRFLDDIALNLRFSWPLNLTHPGIVSHDLVQDAVKRMQALHGNASLVSELKDACVFLAQTLRDRTLIKDGRFFPDSEVIDQVAQALDGRPLVLKPHPLAPDNPLIEGLERRFGARRTDANIYAILANAADALYLTISSSAAVEARCFGRTTKVLHPAAHADIAPVSSLWAHRSASFWRTALTPILRLRPEALFEEPTVPNRLRRLIYPWSIASDETRSGASADAATDAQSTALITAAICTFNRHHLLQDAIGALLKQTLDKRLFKILIVDNSSDQERADAFYRMAGFDRRRVKVIPSQPPGLSRARNVAAAECGTQFIAYLDDDARPDPTWLSSLLAGFRHASEVAAVGGPIRPVWRNGRTPRWLPRKHLGLLTVLEPTESDCNLEEHQYIYGANMAFSVEHLLAMGGFPEQVGRTGAASLLSCEETHLQDALRDDGYMIRFVNSASVRHIVHEDRVRRNWMRSRMAWQSVSEQLQTPPQFQRDWAIHGIKRLAAEDPDVAAAVRIFFKEADGDALTRQLDAIRHFSALLMNAHRMPEGTLSRDFGLATSISSNGKTRMNGYAPSAAGASDARLLFVEALPGHKYLYDLYGELPDAQLLSYYSEDQAWGRDAACQARFRRFLDYVQRSIGRKTEAVFFLTLDGPTYGSNREEFFRFLASCSVPVHGILHRAPGSRAWAEAARRLNSLVENICFLSETMVDDARRKVGLSQACYLPHHPTTLSLPRAMRARESIRARLGIRPGQVVFATIGEARKGKGIPLLLSGLGQLPAEARDKMFFLFAGKATLHSNEEIRRAFVSSRTLGLTDLRTHPVATNYAVLSDREYAEYVAASDIGLLLYQEDQRQCMSGVLGDYLSANCKIVATANSHVGAEVKRHELGIALQREDAGALAATLVDALQLPHEPFSTRAEEYRASIAADAVLRALRELIEVRTKGRGAPPLPATPLEGR